MIKETHQRLTLATIGRIGEPFIVSKDSQFEHYFPTFGKAKAWLIQREKTRIGKAELNIAEANRMLSDIEKLQEPTEVK